MPESIPAPEPDEGEPRRKPLSRSLRFQILRRDNHACRYCGATAPDVKLTVDHVVPVALGGSDDPTNLVAACQGCNAGKDATPPDAEVVADVAQDAARWAAAMALAAKAAQTRAEEERAYRQRFLDHWQSWTFGNSGSTLTLPSNWRSSINRFREAGLTPDLLEECVTIAMRSPVSSYKTFRYMCGVAWRKVSDLQEAAHEILADPEASA